MTAMGILLIYLDILGQINIALSPEAKVLHIPLVTTSIIMHTIVIYRLT